MLSYIIWNFNPDLFSISGLNYSPRWYGVLFALGFIFSQQVMFYIFKKEGRPVKDVEKLTTYMVIAVIVGARLGHCLFYDPVYFLSNPLEILKIWKGGLASHGGAIGIIVALYLFGKKNNYHLLWILDRIVIVVALTGALIRTGNLFNSEMEGLETNSNTGIVYARATHDFLLNHNQKVASVDFKKGGEFVSEKAGLVPITAVITYQKDAELELTDKYALENLKGNAYRYPEVTQHVDFGKGPLKYKLNEEAGIAEIYLLGTVRHAAQMYEAGYCVLLMILLFWFWHKKRNILPRGFNFAMLMILLWSLRFVDEFFKMNQEAFEDSLTLNMGQILSIPLTIAGIIIMILVYRGDKKMDAFN